MSAITLVIISAVVCSIVMLGVWFLQRKLNDAGIVDLAWSLCLGGLAIFYAVLGTGALLPKILMLIFALFWSLRLALHLHVRIRDYPEDGRYLYLREYWGDKQQQGMFWFFQAQAGFAIVFSIPFLVVAFNPVAEFTVWSLLAIIIYLIAVGGESLADWQLAQFKRKPDSKGRTCREGLWHYSRHPNYFFEWLHWFAYVFLSIGSGYWWLTVLAGPVLMFAFLYRFTGIPYTEQQAIRSRGDDYRDYQKTTSAFFPWPPKNRMR